MSERNQSMEEGRAIATGIICSIKPCAETAEEPLLWWAGFMGAISGAMVASIGSAATGVLVEAFGPMLEKLAEEKRQS